MSNKKLQTADLFLTNRGADSYTSVFGDIKENVLDSHIIQSPTPPTSATYPDLTVGTIWVDTSQVPPKVLIWDGTSWVELSGELPVVDPDPTDISFNPPVSGSGTQTDPYVMSPSTSYTIGGTVESNETITMSNQGATTAFLIQTLSGGASFTQPVAFTDATGAWTGKLTYTDTIEADTGTTYDAEFKIGQSSVFIKWSVVQIANQTEFVGGDGVTPAPNASPRDVDDDGEELYGTGTGAWADNAGTLRIVDSGLGDTYTTSIVFGVNGAMDASDKTVAVGDTVTVAFVEADVNAAPNGDTISGALTNDDGYFQVFSLIKDGNGAALGFDDLVDQALSTEVESSVTHGSGHNVPVQLDVVTSTLTDVEASIDGGAWTAVFPVTVNPGQTVQVRGTTGSDYLTAYTTEFSYGGATTTWSVTTVDVVREIVQPTITSPVDGASDLKPEIILVSNEYTPGDPLNPPGPHTASTWEVYESSGSGPKSPEIVAYEPDYRVSYDDCTLTVTRSGQDGSVATPISEIENDLNTYATTGRVHNGSYYFYKAKYKFSFSNVAAGGIWYIGLMGDDPGRHEWRYTSLSNVVINPYPTGHTGTGTNHHAISIYWGSQPDHTLQEWCNTAIEFQNDGPASFEVQMWHYGKNPNEIHSQARVSTSFSPWKGKVPRLKLTDMDFIENDTHYAPSVVSQFGGTGTASGKVAWRPSTYWKDEHTWLLLEEGSVTGTWEAGSYVEDKDGAVEYEAPTTEPPDPSTFSLVSVPAGQITEVDDPANGGSSKLVLTENELNISKAYYSRVKYADDSSTGSLIESEFSPYSEFTTADSFVPLPGDSYGGGYFVAQIKDGGTIYNLVVAPKSSGSLTGENSAVQYKTSATSDPTSFETDVHGAPITQLGADGFHPVFDWCVTDASGPNAGTYDTSNATGTGIGGYNDWYIPTGYELELAYRHLKPSTAANDLGGSGANPYAVPSATTAYTASDPVITTVDIFSLAQTGTEAFRTDNHSGRYWGANQIPGLTAASSPSFISGQQASDTKTASIFARAFRRQPA